jgi:hypothetical protein
MDEARTWFVAFPNPHAVTGGAGWRRLLAPGYRHVWACRAIGADHTLALNHAGSLLQVELVALPIGAFLADRQRAQAAWLLAVQASTPPPAAALRGPMTCVEAVKALLGIRAPFLLTPRQRARHLVRRMDARAILPGAFAPGPATDSA